MTELLPEFSAAVELYCGVGQFQDMKGFFRGFPFLFLLWRAREEGASKCIQISPVVSTREGCRLVILEWGKKSLC
jgi:hypothetical protein